MNYIEYIESKIPSQNLVSYALLQYNKVLSQPCKMVTHHTILQLKFTQGCLQSYAFNCVLFYMTILGGQGG
jgi:hypothetical protein